MKKTLPAIFYRGLWIACVFILCSCFSPWKGDEATIALYLNGAAPNRAASQPDSTILNRLCYEIEINGPTSISLTSQGAGPIIATVVSGSYTISVKAFLDSPGGSKYAEGFEKNVNITPGQNSITLVLQRYFPIWVNVADSPFGTDMIYCVSYGNGKFIAGEVDSITGNIAWSTNGSDWQLIPVSPPFNSMGYGAQNFKFGNGIFVAGGTYGGLAYSTNGTTWSNIPTNTGILSSFGNMGMGIHYINGTFYAFGGAGGTPYPRASSMDGMNWTTISLLDTVLINGLTWGNGTFVAVGYNASNGYIAYSYDGISWSNVTLPAGGSFFSITWGNGTFITGGMSGRLFWSTDGIVWNPVSSSTFGTSDIYCIAWGGGYFIAVGDGGKMAYSSDGVNWIAVTDHPFSTNAINSVTYGDGKFIAVGVNGKIAYSVMP